VAGWGGLLGTHDGTGNLQVIATPGSPPGALVVHAHQDDAAATAVDQVSGVTLNGEDISDLAIAISPYISNVGSEHSVAYCWVVPGYLIPAGQLTVALTVSGASPKTLQVWWVSAPSGYYAAMNGLAFAQVASDLTNPVLLLTPDQAVDHWSFGSLHTGSFTSVPTAGTGFTNIDQHPFVDAYSNPIRANTNSSGNVTFAWTIGSAQESNKFALSFRDEPLPVPGEQHATPMMVGLGRVGQGRVGAFSISGPATIPKVLGSTLTPGTVLLKRIDKFATGGLTPSAVRTRRVGKVFAHGENRQIESEELNFWTLTNVAIVQGAVAGPPGFDNADKVEDLVDVGPLSHFIQSNPQVVIGAGESCYASCRVRAGELDRCGLDFAQGVDLFGINVRLDTGALVSNRLGGTSTLSASRITKIDSVWWLLEILGILNAASTSGVLRFVIQNPGSPYQGTGGMGVYATGFHFVRNTTQLGHPYVRATTAEVVRGGRGVVPTATILASKTVPKALTSALTPNDVLVKQVRKTLLSGNTPGAAPLWRIVKAFTSNNAPIATLGAIKLTMVTLASTETPTATLAKRTSKLLTGGQTPTASFAKQVRKAFAGGLTPAAIVAAIKVILRTLVTRTVTPTATTTRRVQKPLTSGLTPAATRVSRVNKAFVSGSIPTGALARTKLSFVSLTGNVPSSATVSRRIGTALAGQVAAIAGNLARQVRKGLAATVGSSATLVAARLYLRSLTASLQPGGELRNRVWKALGATVTPEGVLTRRVGKSSLLAAPVVNGGLNFIAFVQGVVEFLFDVFSIVPAIDARTILRSAVEAVTDVIAKISTALQLRPGTVIVHSGRALATGGPNRYVYRRFSNVAYTFQAGDQLRYAVYHVPTESAPYVEGAVDLEFTAGGSGLRDRLAFDQNGINAHPRENISAYADGRWYERIIVIPASVVGLTVSAWNTALENNDPGVYEIRVRDIGIWRNGVEVFRPMEDDGSVNNVLYRISAYADDLQRVLE
jgi:hypothetical protein